MSSENTQGRFDQVIRVLVQDLESEWVQLHSPTPSTLYHYTSAQALIDILSGGSIWLTDLRYMNDFSELEYARELIQARASKKKGEDGLTKIQREFLRRIPSGTDLHLLGNSVFAASFCEDGNLLSQWRTYRGDRGGYSIGFDFFHLMRFLDRPCVLRRVIYDELEQERVIDSVLDAFLEFISKNINSYNSINLNSEVWKKLNSIFSSVITEYLVALKHPDFEEEQEWRLVHRTQVNTTAKGSGEIPEFRSYEGNVIPYFDVSFQSAIEVSQDDAYGLGFPVAEVIIGPTLSDDMNQESIKALLSSINPDTIHKVTKSEIPLRWL